VTRDYALVSLRPLAEVLAIDGTDIRSANGGSLDGDEHFSVPRFWDRDIPHLDGAVPRKKRRLHTP
jgi:hypothetical protein